MDPLLSSIIATKNSSLRLGILHSLHKAVYRGSVQGGALGSVSQRRSGYVLYLQVLGSRAKLLELGSTSLYPVTALAITLGQGKSKGSIGSRGLEQTYLIQ